MSEFSNKYISNESISNLFTKLKNEIENAGFKVIQELDIDKILNDNLDVDFDEYKVIGVCNPKLSHEILSQDKSVGLFLPCKIAMYKDSDTTKIELQRPTMVARYFYSKHIESVTAKVEEILDKIIKKIV